MDKLISIIIPVYNTELYLARCLDSVLGNTYRNLEVICINDGSTDNSLAILRDYEAQDQRVVVIDKENGGVSSARNVGLTHMTGDYVTFIDADDFVHPQYIELMLKAVLLSGADCVFAEHKSLSHESQEKSYTPLQITAKGILVVSSTEACKHSIVNCGISSRLIPRALVEKLRFPVDIAYGEDSLFTLELMHNNPSLKVGLMSCQIYYYWIHEGSLVTAGRDRNIICYLNKIASLAAEPGKEQLYLDLLLRRGLYYRYLYTYCQKERSISKEISKLIKGRLKQLLLSRHFPLRYKLTRILFSLSPRIDRMNRLRINPQLRAKETFLGG